MTGSEAKAMFGPLDEILWLLCAEERALDKGLSPEESRLKEITPGLQAEVEAAAGRTAAEWPVERRRAWCTARNLDSGWLREERR